MVVNRCYHTSAQSHVCGWQIPLKLLHPQDPPNPETRIPRYKFKSNQNPRLNLHREMPRKLSFSMWWISGCCIFSGNCHTWAPSTISRRSYRRYRRRSAYFRTIGHLQVLPMQICVFPHHRPSAGATGAADADLRTWAPSTLTIYRCYTRYQRRSAYRVAKTQRMAYLYTSFSAQEPYNSWLFCRK